MAKEQYQAPSLVEIGEFSELTTGWDGFTPDSSFQILKRGDFMR
ncbi:lasso RiPP family leader peptide-containing protein [Streptomyces sp. UNOC14_S4]|nr:lasso RiPP family leader peptide-containing protein [Streptomyces sp. UNOC14_S4]MCC3768556.1 lasso RiPP family leader peptide-containing protein [Streptomyces sp. UNOC14_S4]